MSIRGVVARGSRRAVSLMLDRCEIRAPGTLTGPVDPETGERTVVPGALRYPLPGAQAPLDGRCKLQTYEANEATPDSGQHVYSVERYRIHLPEAAGPLVQVNDEITMTASIRPGNVGRKFRLAGMGSDKTFPTALRLQVDEITA